MGRTRTKTKKNVPQFATAPAEKPAPPSIPALLEKARTLIDQCDYELAERFLHRLLEQSPADVAAREMMGIVQLELGEIDAARKVRN
jgi:Flp pilus assembly protein TadD